MIYKKLLLLLALLVTSITSKAVVVDGYYQSFYMEDDIVESLFNLEEKKSLNDKRIKELGEVLVKYDQGKSVSEFNYKAARILGPILGVSVITSSLALRGVEFATFKFGLGMLMGTSLSMTLSDLGANLALTAVKYEEKEFQYQLDELLAESLTTSEYLGALVGLEKMLEVEFKSIQQTVRKVGRGWFVPIYDNYVLTDAYDKMGNFIQMKLAVLKTRKSFLRQLELQSFR